MKIRLLCTAFAALIFLPAAQCKDDLQDTLARLDQWASRFQSMSANVAFVTHTDVINENDNESGTMVMRKNKAELQALIDFREPASSRRTISFSGRKAQIYYPKANAVQVYDLGKGGEQIEQFVLIGFGTSGAELAKSYTMKVLGTEMMNGQDAIKLELTPKSEDAKKYVTKIELWLPTQGAPTPLVEKVYEPSGNYRLATYSDVKVNPGLSADAVKLKLPSGVKTQDMQTK